jgi:CheY-like chemotaxis protein
MRRSMRAVLHGPILVVEDDADLRDSVCEVLKVEGFRTACAANGREALDWLQKNSRPCAILLDLMMPVMSGSELHAELVKDPHLSPIPVIVLSALDEARQRRHVGSARAYLKKPIDPDVLVCAVQRFC